MRFFLEEEEEDWCVGAVEYLRGEELVDLDFRRGEEYFVVILVFERK